MSRIRRFAATLLVLVLLAPGALADRGIGGTGGPPLRPAGPGTTKPPGTTIVGTIVKFGSVYANGWIVDADDSTPHEGLGKLALGQLVAIQTEAAAPNEARVRGVKIVADPIVIGPLQRAYARGRMQVFGQEVAIERGTHLGTGLDLEAVKTGEMLTVYGLRDGEGVVHATRIERAGTTEKPISELLIRGRASPGPDGRLRVAGIALATPVDAAWIGRIVQVRGPAAGGDALQPSLVRAWPMLEEGGNRISVEGYLGPDLRPDRLEMDGLNVAVPRGTFIRSTTLEAGQHVVVDCVRSADGSWTAERIELPPTEVTRPALPSLPRDLPIPPPLPMSAFPSGMDGASVLPRR